MILFKICFVFLYEILKRYLRSVFCMILFRKIRKRCPYRDAYPEFWRRNLRFKRGDNSGKFRHGAARPTNAHKAPAALRLITSSSGVKRN